MLRIYFFYERIGKIQIKKKIIIIRSHGSSKVSEMVTLIHTFCVLISNFAANKIFATLIFQLIQKKFRNCPQFLKNFVNDFSPRAIIEAPSSAVIYEAQKIYKPYFNLPIIARHLMRTLLFPYAKQNKSKQRSQRMSTFRLRFIDFSQILYKVINRQC